MAARAHLLIRKGRVIDPLSGRDEVADLPVVPDDGADVQLHPVAAAVGPAVLQLEADRLRGAQGVAEPSGLLRDWLTLHLWDEVLQEGCQRAQEVPARVQA